MSASTIDAIHCIIDSAWLLATGWKLPGINCTPAQLGMLLCVFPLIVWFVKNLMSMTFNQDFSTGIEGRNRRK